MTEKKSNENQNKDKVEAIERVFYWPIDSVLSQMDLGIETSLPKR